MREEFILPYGIFLPTWPNIFSHQALPQLLQPCVQLQRRCAASVMMCSLESRPDREPCILASRRSRCPCKAQAWMEHCSSWTRECPRRWAVPDVSEETESSCIIILRTFASDEWINYSVSFRPDGVSCDQFSPGSGGRRTVAPSPAPHSLLLTHSANI